MSCQSLIISLTPICDNNLYHMLLLICHVTGEKTAGKGNVLTHLSVYKHLLHSTWMYCYMYG